jgi:DNA mismatch repair protein MutL
MPLWTSLSDRGGGAPERDAKEPLDARPRGAEPITGAGFPDTAGNAVGRGVRILGQIAGTYIVLADATGLILIDQHAAHERVVYERVKAGRSREGVPRQRLLFPITLELDGPDHTAVVRHLDEINTIGFELEEFGGATLLVSAVPSVVKDADVRRLVTGIAEEIREETGRPGIDETIDRMIKAVACHGSVRAGRELSIPEMERLLAEIENTPFAAQCPHGRPTTVRISVQEMERRFKRM